MSRRSILITGSSGRLGRPLARHLAQDADVVLFDTVEPPDELRALGRVVTGSITDPNAVAEAVDGVDTVIHSAAIPGNSEPYEQLIQVNVMGTFNLLEAAGNSARVERFVYISSVRYHGLLDPPPDRHMPESLPFDETHPALPGNYYAFSKVQSEHWCRKYVRHFGKPVVAVRPPWIVPPEHEPTFEAQPIRDQADLHDYIGTGDLIDGIVRAMDHDPRDGFDAFLFHAVDQHSTTPTCELAETLFPGVPTDREKLEAADGFAALVDCSHARDVLGWSPQFRCNR